MEVNYIQCFQCGKGIGHLYLPYRELRDNDELDEGTLVKVLGWLERVEPPTGAAWKKLYKLFSEHRGEGIKAAFRAIGRDSSTLLKPSVVDYLTDMAQKEERDVEPLLEYVRTYNEIKVSEVFKALQVYRYCCKQRLISPAIVQQQAPFPPKWSQVKIVPDPTVERTVEIRTNQKILRGISPDKEEDEKD